MADQAMTQDLGDVEIEATPRGGLNGKKLVLFIILPLLLVIGGLAGAYFAGLLDPLLGRREAPVEESQEVAAPQTVFFDLPQMLVNLNTGGKKNNYLKIAISLELTSQEDSAALQNLLPRVVDNFQVYLRELRVEDLRGSAGVQRLREELLLRVNNAVHPIVVRDVLFKEMLVQ
ncbi:MAG: flagellar basal body-associated FliL family protein [Bacteroidota bacterium]|nr:flagellar basal body-associated FliL family protein [Kiloniellaceae bacterium]